MKGFIAIVAVLHGLTLSRDAQAQGTCLCTSGCHDSPATCMASAACDPGYAASCDSRATGTCTHSARVNCSGVCTCVLAADVDAGNDAGTVDVPIAPDASPTFDADTIDVPAAIDVQDAGGDECDSTVGCGSAWDDVAPTRGIDALTRDAGFLAVDSDVEEACQRGACVSGFDGGIPVQMAHFDGAIRSLRGENDYSWGGCACHAGSRHGRSDRLEIALFALSLVCLAGRRPRRGKQ